MCEGKYLYKEVQNHLHLLALQETKTNHRSRCSAIYINVLRKVKDYSCI